MNINGPNSDVLPIEGNGPLPPASSRLKSKTRRIFQYHLSTAIVISFFAWPICAMVATTDVPFIVKPFIDVLLIGYLGAACEFWIWRKRHRFRVHLRTVIILTFAAGLLLYLNLQPHSNCPDETLRAYGWPLTIWFSLDISTGNFRASHCKAEMVLDVLLALIILSTIAVISERLNKSK